MSAQLANKVNQLCQKVKNLSKRETSDSKKEYLFAKVGTTRSVDVDENIPYDQVILSNCITLNNSGGAIISSEGLYRITFIVGIISNMNNFDSAMQIAINSVKQSTTYVELLNLYAFTQDATEMQISNSVLLTLEAGDIITVINDKLINITNNSNITIEKL